MSDDALRDAIAFGLAQLPRLVRTPEAVGYGVDLLCESDLDPRMGETATNTVQSLAQDLFHRVTTRRGTNPDDPHLGINVRDFLSAGLTLAQITEAQATIAGECAQDDRVESADVTMTYSFSTNSLRIAIRVTPVDYTLASAPPFTLIIAVTSAAALIAAIETHQ